jgi:uncharacterized protein YegP (UPF0339 family)
LKAKYQVYKDVAGKFRFRLRASNNKIVAVSEAYENKAGCMNGVKSVQNNCGSPIEDQTIGAKKLPHPKYTVFKDAASEFRFNLSAVNGEIIAASEAYENKAGCMNGIEAVQKSCGAEIEDLTAGQMVKAAPKAVVEEPCEGVMDTNLKMVCPPTSVNLNTIVTFKGTLNCSTGKGAEGAKIDIMERDRSFMGNKLLASGMTDKDGAFSIDWKAKQQDWWDDSVEVFAKFEGNEKYNPSQSGTHKIRVLIYLRNKK